MERRPDDDDLTDNSADPPRDPEDAAVSADSVQGWQEDEPTDSELAPDDGYHPEHGGPKYEEADPVDEPLLAQEEGLSEDEEELLEAADSSGDTAPGPEESPPHL
jgi:hypothetical protein